jgi:hypothetical protein
MFLRRAHQFVVGRHHIGKGVLHRKAHMGLALLLQFLQLLMGGEHRQTVKQRPIQLRGRIEIVGLRIGALVHISRQKLLPCIVDAVLLAHFHPKVGQHACIANGSIVACDGGLLLRNAHLEVVRQRHLHGLLEGEGLLCENAP